MLKCVKMFGNMELPTLGKILPTYPTLGNIVHTIRKFVKMTRCSLLASLLHPYMYGTHANNTTLVNGAFHAQGISSSAVLTSSSFDIL